jgi:hypothetical protein
MVKIIHADLQCLTGGTKYCNRGTREWFAAHGLNYDDLHGDGVPAEDVLATGDHRAELVVAQARRRIAESGGAE